jgi:hypothetical protein
MGRLLGDAGPCEIFLGADPHAFIKKFLPLLPFLGRRFRAVCAQPIKRVLFLSDALDDMSGHTRGDF